MSNWRETDAEFSNIVEVLKEVIDEGRTIKIRETTRHKKIAAVILPFSEYQKMKTFADNYLVSH